MFDERCVRSRSDRFGGRGSRHRWSEPFTPEIAEPTGVCRLCKALHICNLVHPVRTRPVRPRLTTDVLGIGTGLLVQ